MLLRLRFGAVLSLLGPALLPIAGFAQSTSQTAPTVVSAPEVNVQIKARDIGDSRLTSYYFEVASGQGDLFINVVARNFTGDIDFFTVSNLRPLGKITVYADSEPWETGRVLYFTGPERILLRIEGRTPNDDPSSIRLKFAGSFVATAPRAGGDPAEPVVRSDRSGGGRVNSVGTILESPADKTVKSKPPATDAGKGAEPAVEDEAGGVRSDDKTVNPKAGAPSAGKGTEPAAEDRSEKARRADAGSQPKPAETRAAEEKKVRPAKSDSRNAKIQRPILPPTPAGPAASPDAKAAAAPDKPESKAGQVGTRASEEKPARPSKPDSRNIKIQKPIAPATPAEPAASPDAKAAAAPDKTESKAGQTEPARASAPGKAPPPPVTDKTVVIVLRDGKQITARMSQIDKLLVEDGYLLLEPKSGSRLRISLSEVQEVSIR